MMDTIIWVLYDIGARRLAYWLAARYMPPIHPLNFDDEPGE